MSLNENDYKYLVYKIGNELYSSPLLSVREVLEYQNPKYMPNMVHHFSGVINVRGAIVGVLDLRLKFGLPNPVGPKTSILLCDTGRGLIAAVVDSVECVQEFAETDVDRKPVVMSKVKQEYLAGVAKSKEQLVTILDLHKFLTEEELKAA
ncbi:MAG TPA: chemotaxis protein CheW [Pseudobdellovibrionaceae bacterium]|jgi:purine-binding chemotaxis protein CheW